MSFMYITPYVYYITHSYYINYNYQSAADAPAEIFCCRHTSEKYSAEQQYQLKILFLHIYSTLPSIYIVNLLTITYKSNAAK